MILYRGSLYRSEENEALLATLEDNINNTRMTQRLDAETVISAFDRLGRQLAGGKYDGLIASLDIDGIDEYIASAVRMLSRDALEFRYHRELDGILSSQNGGFPEGIPPLGARVMPLGTLLHIAAGNADGLPAFSVAEGLITGNVNILKLPSADNGFSVTIIRELLAIEPRLADFIYVFDTPSTDIVSIMKMAQMSDGIVTWGGDAAVSAVRKYAPPGARLIEWGHKLGFAYISGCENREEELAALAAHIYKTKQLLCNSCQVIYLDTVKTDEVYDFCREFLPYMERAAELHPVNDIGAVAELTLRRCARDIRAAIDGETAPDGTKVFMGKSGSLTAMSDTELELSDMFGNCIVKRLPRSDIFSTLRRHKGHLQTVGLICRAEDRDELTDLFARCGLVRVMRAGNMSAGYIGEAHDGVYPLAKYVRVVNYD